MFCHHQKGGDCWPKGHYPGYFDDNKTYLVMYLIILFKRISGSEQVLTTPLKDSHIWSSPKICIPKLKHNRKLREYDVEEKIKNKSRHC